MFVGHIAVGFAAKRFASRSSLGVLMLAAIWVDLIWPVLLMTGLEMVRIVPRTKSVVPLVFVHYPISHSLVMALVWAVVIGSTYWLISGVLRPSIIVGACVVTHWLLDFITHLPDLPLIPGMPARVGLGLWSYPMASMLVEGVLFGIGVVVYVRTTSPRDRNGTWSLIVLVVLVAFIGIGNYVGPPPPSVKAVAGVGLAQWLIVIWAAWIDSHRTLRT